MRSKLLNSVMLAFAVLLEVGNLLFVSSPWRRLGLGVWLLVIVIALASQLELGKVFGLLPTARYGHRRFLGLRSSVTELLAEVRRLNWLVVDLDRGFRNRETVSKDIESSDRRLRELLGLIQESAGRPREGLAGDAYPGLSPAPETGGDEPGRETATE